MSKMVSIRVGAGANLTETQMQAVQEAREETQSMREEMESVTTLLDTIAH